MKYVRGGNPIVGRLSYRTPLLVRYERRRDAIDFGALLFTLAMAIVATLVLIAGMTRNHF